MVNGLRYYMTKSKTVTSMRINYHMKRSALCLVFLLHFHTSIFMSYMLVIIVKLQSLNKCIAVTGYQKGARKRENTICILAIHCSSHEQFINVGSLSCLSFSHFQQISQAIYWNIGRVVFYLKHHKIIRLNIQQHLDFPRQQNIAIYGILIQPTCNQICRVTSYSPEAETGCSEGETATTTYALVNMQILSIWSYYSGPFLGPSFPCATE